MFSGLVYTNSSFTPFWKASCHRAPISALIYPLPLASLLTAIHFRRYLALEPVATNFPSSKMQTVVSISLSKSRPEDARKLFTLLSLLWPSLVPFMISISIAAPSDFPFDVLFINLSIS